MVKSYNELLREMVREMKERNVYHKLITFNHRSKYMTNISKWINVMFPIHRVWGFDKSFVDSNIDIGIEDKLTSQEEANRIKTNILFKLIMNDYRGNYNDLYKISSHYTKVTYDDYKHKNRNEMFYMIHGGTVVASIGSIMLICLINSIFGIYCAIGFTGLLILNILVIIINLFIRMKKNIILW